MQQSKVVRYKWKLKIPAEPLTFPNLPMHRDWKYEKRKPSNAALLSVDPLLTNGNQELKKTFGIKLFRRMFNFSQDTPKKKVAAEQTG